MPFRIRRLMPVLVVFPVLLAACGGGDGSRNASGSARFTLSGTLIAEPGNDLDADIAGSDPGDKLNDTPASAQLISSPVVLGGRVDAQDDPIDCYTISLKPDDLVRLSLPDASTAGIDMAVYLQGEMSRPVGSLTNVRRTTALAVEAAGIHVIKIEARRGGSSYRLMAGHPYACSAQPVQSRSDFVPGQILVRMHPGSPGQGGPLRAFEASGGLRVIARQTDGWLKLEAPALTTGLTRSGSDGSPDTARPADANERLLKAKRRTLEIISTLRRDPQVAAAEPNYIYRTFHVPNDALYALQWNFELINLPRAWDSTRAAADIRIAVLDTGILSQHPDLQGQVTAGYDFISAPDNAGDSEPGVDENPEDPGDGTEGDSTFHGTHVAGIIAAATDNNGLGVAGAAPLARIMPVRVLGRKGGFAYDIANAIRWAAGLDVTIGDGQASRRIPGAAPRADIINMSFGGYERSTMIAQALEEAREAGVILIAAAGNEASGSATYPASEQGVVAVGALDINAQRSPYSNYGHLDVTAPGGDIEKDQRLDGYADGILSTAGTGGGPSAIAMNYRYYHGTSMAAPHVAGVAALMKAVRLSAGENLTPDDFDAYLANGDLTAPMGPALYYGAGMIDAWLAVTAASGVEAMSVLSIAPGALHLGSTQSTATLSLARIGSDAIQIQSIESDAAWLKVGGSAGGVLPANVQVDIDRTPLSGGIHTGRLTVNYSVGTSPDQRTLQVPVTLDKLPDPTADCGTQYLLLIDADTSRTVRQILLESQGGTYPFKLTDIPAGRYYLIAGTDIDQDGFIARQGEAAGAYPSMDEWNAVQVDGDMVDLTFVVGFSQIPFEVPADATLAEFRR